MVAVSGNTGSAPLSGSKVIRDRASDESLWRFHSIFGGKTSVSSVRSEADQTSEWSEKAPLVTGAINS